MEEKIRSTDEPLFVVKIALKRREDDMRLYMTQDEVEGVRFAWVDYNRRESGLSSDGWGLPDYLELLNFEPSGIRGKQMFVPFENIDYLILPMIDDD